MNLGWTTLCLGGYLPGTMVVTSALTGAALAVHLVARAFGRAAVPARAHAAGWLLLPFLVYAAANVLWVTPVRWLGWRDWFWWAEMIAIFWVVLNGVRAAETRRVLFATLMALGVITAVLGCYQRFGKSDWLMLGRVQSEPFIGRASGSFGAPNSLAGFLILLIPAVGALAFRRGARVSGRVGWGGLALVLVVGLVLTISRGAWLGLAVALAAWPLVAGNGNWWRRLGLAVAVAGILAIAGGVVLASSPRARERFGYLVRDMGEKTRPIMWRAAWGLFREHPAVGSGGGSYNVLFERFRPEQFPDEPKWAHNDYLNTLSDYGAVGFGLLLGMGGVVVWRCRRTSSGRLLQREDAGDVAGRDWIDDPLLTRAMAIGMLAFALQLLVEFHFKIPALAMAFATVAALVVARAWPADAGAAVRDAPIRRIATAAAVVAIVVAGWFAVVYRAEELRFRARELIDQLAVKSQDQPVFRVRVLQAEADLARAVSLDSSNGQAWADLAYALSLRALGEPARTTEIGREAETAADHALVTSEVCGEFWIRRGAARDMQGRWLDGGSDFLAAIALAPTNAIDWYYYAYHLSRNPTQRDAALAALAFCLRLDPGNPEGLALRQRLAISLKGP